MHVAGKIFVKTSLIPNRDISFPNIWDFPIFDILIPNLPMRKILKVVGLLTAMIFFQSKKFTACKVKGEKEETIFK